MAISEDRIRSLTRKVIDELGPRATPDNVRRMVAAAIEKLESEDAELTRIPGLDATHMRRSGDQLIVTVFGKNKPGVLAAVAQCLANFQANIIDVSQQLMLDWFTMILVVDGGTLSVPFAELQRALRQIGEEQAMQIHAQHEDVFSAMHRI